MTTAQLWDQIIQQFSGVHLLQTWEWGHAKSLFGWQPLYAVWKQGGGYTLMDENDLEQIASRSEQANEAREITAAALILQRNIPVGGFAQRMSILYVPKGPLLDWEDTIRYQGVLKDLQAIARQRGAIFIKIDPEVRLGSGIPGSETETSDATGQSIQDHLEDRGWRFSDEQVQFRNTCMIDLAQDEEVLLANMKQKTRYNIRLAERKGVKVRSGEAADIPLLYKMYTETAVRDEFVIRDENYYRSVLEIFLKNPVANSAMQPGVMPLIAEVDGEPVAAVVIFMFAGKAWYLYGMSREAHRDKMPNHLLQWEAMHRAKDLGCHTYDLWGAPDQFDESDFMWGVYRFKEGLGASVVRHIGAWDLPVRPFLYRLYAQILPRVLDLMRARQKNQSKRMVG